MQSLANSPPGPSPPEHQNPGLVDQQDRRGVSRQRVPDTIEEFIHQCVDRQMLEGCIRNALESTELVDGRKRASETSPGLYRG
jgi:hypothetical protein